MSFYETIRNIVRQEIRRSNPVSSAKIVRSHPGDKYDIKVGNIELKEIGIVSPGEGIQRQIVQLGNLNEIKMYKNSYKKGDIVKVVAIDGDQNQLLIEGRLDFVGNEDPLTRRNL